MLLSVQIQPIKWPCWLPGGLLEISLFALLWIQSLEESGHILPKKKKKMWKIAKGFFLHLLYLMQSALAKCTALLLVKAVLSFSFLPALELLQRDKVLHGLLTHTVVISQSRLAPCPAKHKLPWSLQLFHGNTTVINTANNHSNLFYVSPLSAGKDSIAPSPWTCANYRAWKEIVTEIVHERR